jgi:arylsulfatase A-like enzyme
VPAIIRQPGRVIAGRVTSALASACDLHPTLLELAGVPCPDDPLAAGRSLAPLLAGVPGADREVVFAYDEYGSARMVRTADAKLVVRSGDQPAEFYDLAEDPGETVDRAGDPGYAAARDELTTVLHDWFAEHSELERDAFHRPVSGRGQLRPAHLGSGAETYHQGNDERRTGARIATR